MSLFLAILLIILAFAGGVFAGMYILRKQVEKEFAENPRLNVEAVRTLLGASGQRPSEAKVLLPPPREVCFDFLSSKILHKEKSLHKSAILHLPSLLDFSSRFVPDFCPV